MPDPTFLTARIAMLLYAAAMFLWLYARRPTATVRLLYTAGWVLLLVHVAAAFHIHHHWSHAAARAHVQEVTARYTGVPSGIGLWLNYLTTALWTADVIFWWAAGTPCYSARPRWVSTAIQALLIFMVFNATVVFGRDASRVIGAIVFATLAVLRWWRVRQRPWEGETPPEPRSTAAHSSLPRYSGAGESESTAVFGDPLPDPIPDRGRE